MMIKFEPILIDTNVLIYNTFHDFDKEKNENSKRILQELYSNKNLLIITPQIIREFVSISTNGKFFEKPLNNKQVIDKIDEFINYFEIVLESENTISILKDLILKYDIKKSLIHDANIVATMIDNNITQIFTFNIKDFQNFREINLIDLT